MTAKPFLRKTRQRRVILEELQRSTAHPTAGELYQVVRGPLPRISLGTVYRNLELLVQAGVVRKLELGGAEARYDGNLASHDHIRCVHCGRVDDVPSVPLELPEVHGPASDSYRILGHRLELLGICPRCRGNCPDCRGNSRENETVPLERTT